MNQMFLIFTREYVNYENYYIKNYWRLQGIQTNFSYNMYSLIEAN